MAIRDFLRSLTPYKLYVLTLCVLAYLLNQLDRYLLPVMTQHIAQELKYGDQGCLNNKKFNSSVITDDKFCSSVKNENECNGKMFEFPKVNETVCMWNYTGQGEQYQIIAGPVFIVIYTLCGIFIGYLTIWFKRKTLLAFFLVVWSVFTALSGATTEYWQLVLTRFGLGIGEAGCTPFAAAIIGELFTQELRGTAMGIYNFGIYFGYSMSYAFGNFLYNANIMGKGWRWVFYISAMGGLPVALLLFFTIKEQSPTAAKEEDAEDTEESPLVQQASQREDTWREKLKSLFFAFLSPPLLMLCLAGSIRNAGGYTWAVNTQLFFESKHQTSEQIGTYMSWIPLVGGSLGAFFGGFISDRVVKGRGIAARIAVLMVSQICAAPFALLALLLPAPACYIMLIPSNIIGEMWIGVCLTCVLELVPEKIRAASVGYYLFIITNIGGNIPLLLPPLRTAFAAANGDDAFRNALIVLFPGMYVASSVLFLLTIIVYRAWLRRQERYRI